MKTIDVHTHGIGGFDTTAVSENDILRIAGINLEGPFLNPARCGALNADSFMVSEKIIIISDSVKDTGIDKDIVMRAISENPEKYLG